MRKSAIIHFLMLTGLMWACRTPEPGPEPIPDPDPEATITLDELEDRKEYSEGMIVDSRLFRDGRVALVAVNQVDYAFPLSLDLRQPGYYHLEISFSGDRKSAPQIIRLVVLDAERGDAEWGLAPWTPQGVDPSLSAAREVRFHYPAALPEGQDLPLIVSLDGPVGSSILNAEASAAASSFLLKRGVGSTWIPPGDWAAFNIRIGNGFYPLGADTLRTGQSLGGRIDSDVLVPAGSMLSINEDLYIERGVCLRVEHGVFISISEGINIYNEGRLTILGRESEPVVLTSADPGKYWGGIIGREAGNLVEASHCIFARSGFHSGPDYNWGHAHRQALIYCDKGRVDLDHCHMIDHIGQVFYTRSASLELESCLVQRCKTGGELSYTQLQIWNSVFTDFPDESLSYRDDDNDALYLVECTGQIENSVFMYACDDGLDSGSGGEGGHVVFRNCRFESVFHEGAALSGGANGKSKIHRFHNCVFMDCGQGLELGFSSPEHEVHVDSCTFLANGIGIRYGDNYGWGNKGTLWVSNSSALGNASYDVWNMTRDDWVADTAKMIFDNVWVSKENPMYPQLKLIE